MRGMLAAPPAAPAPAATTRPGVPDAPSRLGSGAGAQRSVLGAWLTLVEPRAFGGIPPRPVSEGGAPHTQHTRKVRVCMQPKLLGTQRIRQRDPLASAVGEKTSRAPFGESTVRRNPAREPRRAPL
jgi:hypothetical protein